MKDKVLAFLKDGSGVPEERYNEAMALLQKSEGKSVAQVNSYYRSGFTETNLKNICYDLQQLHGIPDVEIASGSKKSTKSKVLSTKSENGLSMDLVRAIQASSDEVKIAIVVADKYPELWESDLEVLVPYSDAIVDFAKQHKDLLKVEKKAFSEDKYRRLFVEAVGDVVIPEELEITISDTDIPKNGTDVTNNETISIKSELESASEEVKSGLKVRERFAFLGETDCPDKFKILVNDFFTALDAFKAGHAALLIVTEEGKDNRTLTDAEIYAIGKETIDAFQLKQSIWDELEFYNEHKEVLGNHPIFADDQLKEKVAAMSDVDLVNRQKNVRSYISKENKKLKSAKDEAATTKIKKKIQELNQELNLLDERIGAKK